MSYISPTTQHKVNQIISMSIADPSLDTDQLYSIWLNVIDAPSYLDCQEWDEAVAYLPTRLDEIDPNQNLITLWRLSTSVLTEYDPSDSDYSEADFTSFSSSIYAL